MQSVLLFLELVLLLWKWFKAQNDPAAIVARAHEVFGQLEKARTVEEKSDAAKAIQDLLRR